MIRGTTQVFGILGDPIKHSLSPVMQNAAFAAIGMDAVYVPFHVTPDALADAIRGLRAQAVRGVNVTIPHKETVCPFLDQIDADAELIGAVNTIVLRDGQLIGYNTDGIGLVNSLKADLGIELRDRCVVVLGAGGAARAAIVALAQQGVRTLAIANRNVNRAKKLVERYREHFPTVNFSAVTLDKAALHTVVSEADLIVNSTAIGLSGESFNVLPWDFVKSSCAIYDMVYAAGETPLVKVAKHHGFLVCDGLGMLIAQGEAAFKLWTHQHPGDAMRSALERVRQH